MINQTYDDLNLLLKTGQYAYQYAWDNFEALAGRYCAHTLFGPASCLVGALSPSHTIGDTVRRLRKKPGSGRYTIYELDENHQVIRIKHVRHDNRIDCTYHVFELEGVTYARSFFQDKKSFYKKDIVAIKFADGLPEAYIVSGPNRLAAEFYEYLSPTNMRTTTYTYYPNSIVTSHGVPMSFDSPMGTPESPVQLLCTEEPIHFVDFSQWFSSNDTHRV